MLRTNDALTVTRLPGLSTAIRRALSARSEATGIPFRVVFADGSEFTHAEERARKYLAVQMEEYFFGSGGAMPAGYYVPPRK